MMTNPIVSQLTKFFSNYNIISYKKGEILFRPGDTFTQVSFVKSGYIRLYSIDKDGKEITLSPFKPLFFLSLAGALNQTENEYYFEAVTPVEIWRAPKDEFLQFITAYPNIHLNLTDKLLQTLTDNLSHIVNILSGDAFTKIASLLFCMARREGTTDDRGRITINFETTHQIIASLTGLTRETTSIQIKKLENMGLIEQNDHRFVIVKPAEMQKLTTCPENLE